jgi:TonB-dependent SusC/RagA subfamily outer membrane receptor
MMKKLNLVLFSLLIAALVAGFIRQDETLKKIISKIEKYRSGYPQEKVHLHMDKPYYAIGDNIWFKAYVVNAERNELSALSSFLYVELINDKDAVKQSLKLPLNMGLTSGDFELADTLMEGNYRIRAYTTWMRNFGEEFFFDKTIRVGNSISNTILTHVDYTLAKDSKGQKVVADINYADMAGNPLINKEVNYSVDLNYRNILKSKGFTDEQGNLQISFVNNQPFILKSGNISTSILIDEQTSVSKTFPVKATSNEVDVQFFPEGGDLVSGLLSRVAFKAVRADGLGANISGYLSSTSNARILEFRSEHAGMGYFRFQPHQNEIYTAHIQFEDGSEKTFPLPRILPQGFVLKVNNTDAEDLSVSVITNESLRPDAQFTLIAQSNGYVHFIAKNKLEAQAFNARIPKRRFPTGILHLTLFSPDNEPVAERLVFINHNDFLDINMDAGKTEFKKREKINLAIDVKDAEGKPTTGSFSIAVIDESMVPFNESDETTIISNLLFSSDLKGFIERPNYYFHDIDKNKIRQLDLLMMTQGWRRFEWKNILSDVYPSLSFMPESSMEISGRVRATNGRPVVGGKVTLFSSEGDVFLLDTLTDTNGAFRFENLHFSDSTSFVIQARNEKDRKNVEIILDRIPPQLLTSNKNEPMVEVNVNRSMLPYLHNSKAQYEELKKYGVINKSILLAEVKVVERKPVVNHSANLNGAGNADAVIRSDQLLNCYDLAQCLQGRVAGVLIQGGIAYSLRSMNSSFRGLIPMQLILDGMYVEPNFLSSINPNDVETIEVLKSGGTTAIYGIRGGGGVLVINTKRAEANRDYRSYAPGIMSYRPKGISKAREFYSPNYDDPATDSRIADLRTTVYWNPNVVSDSTGKAAVEFFNADGTGNYKAIIEGINLNGTLGRNIYRYSVK